MWLTGVAHWCGSTWKKALLGKRGSTRSTGGCLTAEPKRGAGLQSPVWLNRGKSPTGKEEFIPGSVALQ